MTRRKTRFKVHGPGAAKYSNEKVVVDGIKFDSKREAARYQELKLMEQAKVIKGLVLQPRFRIEIGGVEVRYASGRQVVYVADFEYWDNERKTRVVEDAKGMPTPLYKLKRALMAAMGETITEI